MLDVIVEASRFLKEEDRTTIFTPAARPEPPSVIKLYRRRGCWNTVRGWLVRYRAEREYRRLRFLEDRGIACTRALGWAHGYAPEHGFYEVLATERIPDATDLETVIRAGGRPDLGVLIGMVRRMHRQGFRHQALYARNVITTRGGSRWRFYIADVPRARVFPYDLTGTRMARLDFADLFASLLGAGLPEAALRFDAWGIPPLEQLRIRRTLARYSKSRPRRILRDIECRCRHAFACAATALLSLPLPPA
ncbi:MAG: lipopolysaccharide kinase InaA family protein [Woeseiaceae bacterium]|nr:lipopolysaccharide kinase InaA family protein [Woeseiaceae bacterium]